MHDQAVSSSFDERELQDSSQGWSTVHAKHRAEDRFGDPANNRRSLQRLLRGGILDVLDVQPRELFDDTGHGGILELQLGMLGNAGRGKCQRQWMTAPNSVQSPRLVLRDP